MFSPDRLSLLFVGLLKWIASTMARANFSKRGRFALTIASRDRALFHQNGIFKEPMSKKSRKPSFKASRTNGSGMMVNWITPFDSAANLLIASGRNDLGVAFRIEPQPS
jgi:hypothetical protein